MNILTLPHAHTHTHTHTHIQSMNAHWTCDSRSWRSRRKRKHSQLSAQIDEKTEMGGRPFHSKGLMILIRR